jgi:hypothetical protein
LAFTEAVWRTTDAPLDEVAKEPAMHRIVAEVELATPASERRLVQTDDFNETGRVLRAR